MSVQVWGRGQGWVSTVSPAPAPGMLLELLSPPGTAESSLPAVRGDVWGWEGLSCCLVQMSHPHPQSIVPPLWGATQGVRDNPLPNDLQSFLYEQM